MNQTNIVIVPDEVVMIKIYMMRDQKVMLDEDSWLYGVETRWLNEQVKRDAGGIP